MDKVEWGILCEEGKKCCGFFLDHRSMEWVQTYGLEHKITTMGNTFYIRKFPRHELFQTRMFGVLYGTNQSEQVTIAFASQMCLLQSLFSSVHLKHYSGREPPKTQF